MSRCYTDSCSNTNSIAGCGGSNWRENGGCGRSFCSSHLFGHAGPFFCRPCWDAKKAKRIPMKINTSPVKSDEYGTFVDISSLAPQEVDDPRYAALCPVGPGPYSRASSVRCSGPCGLSGLVKHSIYTYVRSMTCSLCAPQSYEDRPPTYQGPVKP